MTAISELNGVDTRCELDELLDLSVAWFHRCDTHTVHKGMRCRQCGAARFEITHEEPHEALNSARGIFGWPLVFALALWAVAVSVPVIWYHFHR